MAPSVSAWRRVVQPQRVLVGAAMPVVVAVVPPELLLPVPLFPPGRPPNRVVGAATAAIQAASARPPSKQRRRGLKCGAAEPAGFTTKPRKAAPEGEWSRWRHPARWRRPDARSDRFGCGDGHLDRNRRRGTARADRDRVARRHHLMARGLRLDGRGQE
jgi:hypothetical protein